MTPYIYAYFKDNLPTPYNLLWGDYRQYPDSDKVWNLSVKWLSEEGGNTSSDITISWNGEQINLSEYNTVMLNDNSGNPLVNMKTTSSYTYTSPDDTTTQFKIICHAVNHPPVFDAPSPSNESIDVNRFHATNVTVSDLDGNLTTVCFWYSLSNSPYSWTKAQQNNSVAANTTVRDINTSWASSFNTKYWWKVTAEDEYDNVSKIFYFTTLAGGVYNGPDFYVDGVSGSNGNNGSLSYPWKTIEYAIGGYSNTKTKSGDTIYILGGTYTPVSRVLIYNKGSAGNVYTIQNYNGETVII
jgi:hypothetical protein